MNIVIGTDVSGDCPKSKVAAGCGKKAVRAGRDVLHVNKNNHRYNRYWGSRLCNSDWWLGFCCLWYGSGCGSLGGILQCL